MDDVVSAPASVSVASIALNLESKSGSSFLSMLSGARFFPFWAFFGSSGKVFVKDVDLI